MEVPMLSAAEIVSAEKRPPIPSFTINKTGFTGVTEAVMLGLPKQNISSLKRGKYLSIQQIYDTDIRVLGKIRGISETADVLTERLTAFRQEVVAMKQQQADPSAPVEINARKWMHEHNLMWNGVEKTPQVREIESYLPSDLGSFLYDAYVGSSMITTEIATVIRQQSGGLMSLNRSDILALIEKYTIPKRTASDNARLVGVGSQKIVTPAESPNFEGAKQGKMWTDVSALKGSIAEAKANGNWELLNDRERYVLQARYSTKNIPAREPIAQVMGTSAGNIRMIEYRALVFLRRKNKQE